MGVAAAGHHVQVVATHAPHGPEYVLDGVTVRPRGKVAVHGRDADIVLTHLTPNNRVPRWAVMRTTDWTDPPVADLIVFNSRALRDEIVEASGWDGESLVIAPPVWPNEYRTTPGDEVTLVNISAAKGAAVFWQLAERMPDQRFLGVMGGYGTPIGHTGHPLARPQRRRQRRAS